MSFHFVDTSNHRDFEVIDNLHCFPDMHDDNELCKMKSIEEDQEMTCGNMLFLFNSRNMNACIFNHNMKDHSKSIACILLILS